MTEQQHGYRHAEIKPYCSICGKVADKNCPCCSSPVCLEHVHRCECGKEAAGACLRCGRPLCEDHAPPEDKRCEQCEAEDMNRVGDHPLLGQVAIFLMAFGFVFYFGVLEKCSISTNVGLSLAVGLGTVAVTSVLGMLGRRRFLRERPKKKMN